MLSELRKEGAGDPHAIARTSSESQQPADHEPGPGAVLSTRPRLQGTEHQPHRTAQRPGRCRPGAEEFPRHHTTQSRPVPPRCRRAQGVFHAADSCLPTSLLLPSCSADGAQLARPEHSPFLRLGFGAGISPAALWTLSKPSNTVRDAPRSCFLQHLLIAANESLLHSHLLQARSVLTHRVPRPGTRGRSRTLPSKLSCLGTGGSSQEPPHKDQGWDSRNPLLLPSSWTLSPNELRLLNGKGPTGRCQVGHQVDGPTGAKLPGRDSGQAPPWRGLPGSRYSHSSAPGPRGAQVGMKSPERQTRTLWG